MIISKVSINDSPSVQQLSSQLGYDYPIEKVKNQLQKVMNNPEHQIFIATDCNQIIGFIHLQIYSLLFHDDLLNLLGIVVDKKHRGKGVGSALLNQAEIYAIENKCSGIRANSGISREMAHKFYQKHGFNDTKGQKRFIKYIVQ